MKRIINIISLFLVTWSCSFLDRDSGDNMSKEQLFSRIETAEAYINNLYIFLPDFMCDTENFAGRYNSGCFTDEMGFQQQTNYGVQSPFGINTGSWSPTSMPLQKNRAEYYQCIRHCNLLIENYGLIPDDDTGSAKNRKERLLGEAYGLRGYFYYLLFRQWGGVPRITTPIDPGDEAVMKSIKRASAEDTVKGIVDDLEEAAKHLPAKHDDTNFGRITSLVAKVAISQVKLLWASPLWNPEGGPDHDARWEAAATAAKDAYDLALENGHVLEPNYANLFKNTIPSEYIWTKNSVISECFFWDYYHFPTGFGGAYNVEGPLQEMIDAFEMNASGELPVLGYTEDNQPILNDKATDYDPNNPWSGRDPRFYHDIMCHNDPLQGEFIDTSEGSAARFGSQNRTFYYVRKYTDVTHDMLKSYGDFAFTYRRFAIIRTSELYLNLAEALNESGKDIALATDLVNALRKRAGCATTIPSGLSKEQLRERIRRERRVELCFEGHRFYDVRRWDISRIVDNGMTHRVEVTVKRDANGDKIYDSEGRTIVVGISYPDYQRRYFKANLFPIPQSEIDKNGALEQNQEWLTTASE